MVDRFVERHRDPLSEKLREMGIGFQSGSSGFAQDRPTLVMIHGAGGQAQIWQNQLRLSPRINTLALDLPGHGHTQAQPNTPHMETYAAWLRDTLDALFDRPVYLMGHSMGGAVVQKTACDHPQQLAGIILVGTGPRLRVAPMFLEGLKERFEQTVENLLHFAYAPQTDPAIIHAGAQLMKAAGQTTVYNDFKACNRFEIGDALQAIRLPCLMVCGEADKLTPPFLSEALHQSIPSSTLQRIPGAGHMVMIEQADNFNRCVLDFVSTSQA